MPELALWALRTEACYPAVASLAAHMLVVALASVFAEDSLEPLAF